MDNHNSDAGRREPPNRLVRAFQASTANEALLFELVDFFPFPIEIFSPDGTTVFVNRAACDTWNVDGQGEIIGRYNILHDPVVNDVLGMRREVEQAFAGETVALSDRIVALEDIGSRYRTRNPHSEVESVYSDIFCFPIVPQLGKAACKRRAAAGGGAGPAGAGRVELDGRRVYPALDCRNHAAEQARRAQAVSARIPEARCEKRAGGIAVLPQSCAGAGGS